MLPSFGGDWGLQSSHQYGCDPTKGSESPFFLRYRYIIEPTGRFQNEVGKESGKA